jgi:hypothetical protein
MLVDLRHLAHLRTGDKGNTVNIAVISYSPEFIEPLTAALTIDAVLAFYNGTVTGPGRRFLVPSLGVINLVLDGALAGGVSRTLRLDQFGKSLGAALLGFKVEVDDSLVPLMRGQHLLRLPSRHT